MPTKKISYKSVITRLLDCPKDNRTKEAKNFWGRESATLAKLFKKYDNPDFWYKVNFKSSICESGKLPSFLLFFDKDNNYWINYLNKKWRDFHWKPPKTKTLKFKKNCDIPIVYKKKKRNLRDFLS